MNQVKLKITFGEILIFMLFVSIFRPYFLPSTVYQMIKVIVVGIAFIFLIAKAKGILINWSILVCISIIVSSFISFYTTSSVTVRQVLDAVVYAGCFYCCYTLIHYYGLKGKRYELVKILFYLNLVYCLTALIFLNFPLGYETGDSNLFVYIFGNKFDTSYLFMQLVALYYTCYGEKIHKFLRFKICLFILIGLSIVVSLLYGCTTAFLAALLPGVILINPKGIRNKLYNPVVILAVVIITAILPFMLQAILTNPYIQDIIVNRLHRQINLSGRMNIYTKYLLPVIGKKFWFGHGYINTAMKTASIYYTNAQNGLLHHFVRYGIIGGAVIVVFIVHCFRKSEKSRFTDGALIMVYAMLLAGIVEVTYNWYFFIALFIISMPNEFVAKTKHRNRRLLSKIKVKW